MNVPIGMSGFQKVHVSVPCVRQVGIIRLLVLNEDLYLSGVWM